VIEMKKISFRKFVTENKLKRRAARIYELKPVELIFKISLKEIVVNYKNKNYLLINTMLGKNDWNIDELKLAKYTTLISSDKIYLLNKKDVFFYKIKE